MRRQQGFTMVEMLAVLAVITILALMAVPSYLDKVVKAQIEAALPLADIAKRPIAAIWSATQEMPADNEAAGLPVAEKIVNNYVSAVTVTDGVIDVTFGNRASKAIAGKVLSLRPAVVEDAPVVPVAWVCGNAEAPEKMTVMGQNRTDVDPLYLPIECRALRKAG
ncbi:MAG: pilin [Rhodocyclales bacterium]|nr:pilin [Rhodocyclales bacterium]